MGFTKLDSGIVDSSIWAEPPTTRVVWVTFLAKCNSDGFVAASLSGMLRACNVPEEQFNEAVKTLESPDPDSRTPDNNGKRIEKVEGGWIVLNYKKYREYSYSDNPEAIRKRKYRNHGTCPQSVPKCPGHSVDVINTSFNSSKDKDNKASKASLASKADKLGDPCPTTIPPQLEWVRAYCEKRKNGIDAEAFIAHYGKCGWKDKNGNKIKNWEMCVITWEKFARNNPRPKMTNFLSGGNGL